MLDAKTVGSQLGLSARKIYELARSGDLLSYRFGDAVRFEQADVDAYKARCKVMVRAMPPLELSVPRSRATKARPKSGKR